MPFSFKPATEGSQETPAPAAVPSLSSLSHMTESAASGNVMTKVLFGVFALVLIATASLFVYTYYLRSQIDIKKGKLAAYEKNLAGFPLADMRRVSNRMKVIAPLVKQHPSVNTAFGLIEDSIENPVTYTRFDLKRNALTNSFDLSLAAYAPDYRSVVQQVDTLKNKPYTTYISNLSLDGLHPDDTGRVQFNLKMSLGLAGIMPEELVLQTTAAAVAAATANTPQNTATTTATSTTQIATSTQASQATTPKKVTP